MPFASTEKINQELDRLVNTGILSKEEFNEWAAPTVYIRKKSKEIRVCADFSTGLNAALKDYHNPLPCPEEVFNKLNGGKVFSKIDLIEAYLQIPVEENSSKLLCINTQRTVQIRLTSFWNKNRTGYLPTGDGHNAERLWLHFSLSWRYYN